MQWLQDPDQGNVDNLIKRKDMKLVNISETKEVITESYNWCKSQQQR